MVFGYFPPKMINPIPASIPISTRALCFMFFSLNNKAPMVKETITPPLRSVDTMAIKESG